MCLGPVRLGAGGVLGRMEVVGMERWQGDYGGGGGAAGVVLVGKAQKLSGNYD